MPSNVEMLIHQLAHPEDFGTEETLRVTATVTTRVNRTLDYLSKKYNISKTRLAGDFIEAVTDDLISELKPDPNTDSDFRRILLSESQEEVEAQALADLEAEKIAVEQEAKKFFEED